MRCNLGFIGRLTLVGACALALSAGSAQADTVSLKFTGSGIGDGNVRVTSALAGLDDDRVIAKVLNIQTGSTANGTLDANRSYEVFCTELAQYASSSTLEYNEDSVAALPQPGSQMGADAATAIKRMWAFAGDNKFTDGNWAAAFQIAVWEVVDEFINPVTGTPPTLDITVGSGNFFVDSGLNSTAQGYVSQLLAAAVDQNQSQANLIGLWNSSSGDDGTVAQDFIVEVPEPTSIALLAIGFVCAGGQVLRRRRQA